MHWIPQNIYLDKFATYKVNYPTAIFEKDLITNFDRSMKMLWCKLIFAHSPQAKWRVERANKTFQDRFVKKLRLHWINDIQKANEYLHNVFIPEYNNKFSVRPKVNSNLHKKYSYQNKLERIFAKQEIRKPSFDFVIQYKTRCFQLIKTDWIYLYPKKIFIVCEIFDNWDILILDNNTPVNYKEIDYDLVRMNRSIYFKEKKNLEKQKLHIIMENRNRQRFIKSKEKQIKFKVQRLIDKFE